MKTAAILGLILLAGWAHAQISLSDGLGDSSVGVAGAPKTEKKVVQLTLVTEKRKWTDTKGKVIEAALMGVPVVVGNDRRLRVIAGEGADEKIQLFMNNQTYTLPLARLAKADQDLVRGIAKAGLAPAPTAKGTRPPPAEAAAPPKPASTAPVAPPTPPVPAAPTSKPPAPAVPPKR